MNDKKAIQALLDDKEINPLVKALVNNKKIKVYRTNQPKSGKYKENEGFTWYATKREVAEKYQYDKGVKVSSVQEYEIDEPKNVYPFLYKERTDIRAEGITNRLRDIVGKKVKAKELKNFRPILDLIEEYEALAGDNLEKWHTKINKPGAAKVLAEIFHRLGYDAISAEEDGVLTYGIIISVSESKKVKVNESLAGKYIEYTNILKDITKWKSIKTLDSKNHVKVAYTDDEKIEQYRIIKKDGAFQLVYIDKLYKKATLGFFNSQKELAESLPALVKKKDKNTELNYRWAIDDFMYQQGVNLNNTPLLSVGLVAELANLFEKQGYAPRYGGNMLFDFFTNRKDFLRDKFYQKGNDVEKAKAVFKEMHESSDEILGNNSVKARILGKKIKLRLPNKETRNAQFAIVELASLIPSHNPFTFADNPDFPTNKKGFNINDRNYAGDPNAQALVQQYAQELRPELLITTSKTPQGSPIIDKENIVVSGNNRSMSLQLAAKKYEQNYYDYVQELRAEYDSFGFEEPIESLDSFEQPVLVRIDYDFPEYTTQEMAKYNQSEIKGKRPVDKAIELSNILNENRACSTSIPSILENYERLSDFYANRSDQKRMMDMLLGCNLLTQQETTTYYDPQTGFTSTGKDFLEATLSASILDRNAILAADKAGVKSFRRIIVTTLPTLMTNKGLGKDRLTECINDAVIYQMELQASGLKFNEYINQPALFEQRQFNVKAIYLNRLMHTGRNRFKKAIDGYNNTIQLNQGASLFGEKPDAKEAFEFHVLAAIQEGERKLIEKYKGGIGAGNCGEENESNKSVESKPKSLGEQRTIENLKKGHYKYTWTETKQRLWNDEDGKFSKKSVETELAKYRKMYEDVKSGRVRPSEVVGRGYKKPKQAALEWITKRVEEYKEYIEQGYVKMAFGNWKYHVKEAINSNVDVPDKVVIDYEQLKKLSSPSDEKEGITKAKKIKIAKAKAAARIRILKLREIEA